MIAVGQSSCEKGVGMIAVGAAGRPVGRAVSVVLMAQLYAGIRGEGKPDGAGGG